MAVRADSPISGITVVTFSGLRGHQPPDRVRGRSREPLKSLWTLAHFNDGRHNCNPGNWRARAERPWEAGVGFEPTVRVGRHAHGSCGTAPIGRSGTPPESQILSHQDMQRNCLDNRDLLKRMSWLLGVAGVPT